MSGDSSQSITNKKAYAFNKKTNQFEPINLIPTNLVKCHNCLKYHEINQIDEHMKTHSNGKDQNKLQQQKIKNRPDPLLQELNKQQPSERNNYNYFRGGFLKMATENNKLHDVKCQGPLVFSNTQQNTSAYSSSINDIRTMVPLQLPRNEQILNEIKNPQYRPNQGFSRNVQQPRFEIQVDNRNDIVSKLNQHQVNKQEFATQEYFEPIKFNAQKLNVQKKQIQLFDKIPENILRQKDKFIDSKKETQMESEGKNQKKYSIQKSSNKKKDYHQRYSEQVKNEDKIVIMIDDEIMLPVQRQVKGISTSIKKRKKDETIQSDMGSRYIKSQYREENQCKLPFWSTLCMEPRNIVEDRNTQILTTTRHGHYDKNLNLSCKGCGGFYCPICKSTIPPQYRMPPNYSKQDFAQSRKTNHTFYPSPTK